MNHGGSEKEASHDANEWMCRADVVTFTITITTTAAQCTEPCLINAVRGQYGRYLVFL